MTLHLYCGRWLPIVSISSEAIRDFQKVLNHQSSTYPADGINLFSVVHQFTRGTLS